MVAALGLFLLATASGDTAVLERQYPLLLALNAALAVLLAGLVLYQLVALVRRYRARVFGTRLTLRLLARFAIIKCEDAGRLVPERRQGLGVGVDGPRYANQSKLLLLGEEVDTLDAGQLDLCRQFGVGHLSLRVHLRFVDGPNQREFAR